MKLEFIKMHACGNDYIYVDCFRQTVTDPVGLAKSLSIRRFSIGSDGLVLIMPGKNADVKMRIFNADGSEAGTCGNAVRCVAKYAYDAGIVKKKTINVETLSGTKGAKIISSEGKTSVVAVEMGRATFTPKAVPVISAKEVLLRPYRLGKKIYLMTCLSVGNPHAVITVDDYRSLSVARVGKIIENDGIFPEKTNVEFVKILSKKEICVRVWERGSGITYSCGTGACASVVSCAVNGLVPFERQIKVRMKGGDLFVRVSHDLSVTLKGEAVKVYDGAIDI